MLRERALVEGRKKAKEGGWGIDQKVG